MIIGVLQFELVIPGSQSLKDKRRVVRSFKDRIHREHQVSVAEVGALDHQRLALLGASIVAGDAAYANSVLDRVLAKARELPDAHLGAAMREVLHGSALDWTPSDEEAERNGAPPWTESEAEEAAEQARRAADEWFRQRGEKP